MRSRFALGLCAIVVAGRVALAATVAPRGLPVRGASLTVAFEGLGQRCCTLTAGGDALSGLVWRGLEFTGAPSLQPWLEAKWGAATLEAAASLAVDGSWADQSTALSYGFSTPAGSVDVLGALEVFPGAEIGVPSPVFEVGGEYTAPAPVPVRVLVTRNVVHDPDNAMMAEVAVSHEWSAFAAEAFADAALNESVYYDARAGDVLQAGLGVSRELRVTDRVALTASGAAIYSPAHRRGWLVATVGFWLPLRAPRH